MSAWPSALAIVIGVLAVVLLQQAPPDRPERPYVRNLNALLFEGLWDHWTTNSTGDLDVIYELAGSEALVGRTCLVTGASRGLGYWIAARLASLGCNVVVAARSGSDELALNITNDAATLSPSVAEKGLVRAVKMDLGDLHSVGSALDTLRGQHVVLDVAILNAGVAPSSGWKTPHGLEAALGINCIGNAYLMEQLLERGLIPNAPKHADFPRLVVVSSESHRTVAPLNLTTLAEFEDYGMAEGMLFYGRSKLCLNTFWSEFVRRSKTRLAVHGLCPGPVATSIASDAPAHLQPLIDVFMSSFQPSLKAATPVIALAASSRYNGDTGVYQHMSHRVPVRADAADPAKGSALYDKVQSIIQQALSQKS
eukprot:m.487411 g.487411  ORF g.487411 m.487411 type:complete len:367 (+) comp25002_c0_seq1:139-1239(+)